MTDYIELTNEIKYVLSQFCDGKEYWDENNLRGLKLNDICAKISGANKDDIELVLKTETQTFYYCSDSSIWVMYPEFVDSVRAATKRRRERITEVYNTNNLSRFISSDSLRRIILYREEDFNRVIKRCEMLPKVADCLSKYPAIENENLVLRTSDYEFNQRIQYMLNKTLRGQRSDNILLSTVAFSSRSKAYKKAVLEELLKITSQVEKKLDTIEGRVDYLEERYNPNKEHKIQFADFVVKGNIFRCNSNHSIEQVQAFVDVMTSNGEIVTEKVTAGYCRTCKCYFILEVDFNNLRGKGVLLCQLLTYDAYIKKGFAIMSGEELKPESLLHQSGYNVSASEDLSTQQRQEILKLVVDNGLYTVSGICSHLDWLISRNKKITNRDMSEAIAKWTEDRQFISSYKSESQRVVGINKIKSKK